MIVDSDDDGGGGREEDEEVTFRASRNFRFSWPNPQNFVIFKVIFFVKKTSMNF